jgi:hypothetical protein
LRRLGFQVFGKVVALKGRGFSRAACAIQSTRPSGPEDVSPEIYSKTALCSKLFRRAAKRYQRKMETVEKFIGRGTKCQGANLFVPMAPQNICGLEPLKDF